MTELDWSTLLFQQRLGLVFQAMQFGALLCIAMWVCYCSRGD